MPTYTYRDIISGELVDLNMTISEMEKFEKETQGIYSRVLVPVAIGDPIRIGVTKQPSSWNDLVKTIRKRNYGSNLSHGNGEN